MHKRVIIILIAAVALIGTLTIIVMNRQVHVRSPFVFLDEPQQVTSDELSGTKMQPTTEIDVIEGVPSTQTTREQMLAQYAGKVLSFDAICSSYPRELTVAQRTVIMLNNRDPKTRQIVIQNRMYTIDGNDYALAAINEKGTFGVSCDGRVSAQLTVK